MKALSKFKDYTCLRCGEAIMVFECESEAYPVCREQIVTCGACGLPRKCRQCLKKERLDAAMGHNKRGR